MKAILVLDDISKERVKSNVSTLISRGIYLVSSLDEITEVMLTDTSTVIILEGMLKQAFGLESLRVYKECLNLEYIFLVQKTNWDPILKTIGRIYRTNIVNLSFEILQAAIYDDKALVADDELSDMDSVNLANKVIGSTNSTHAESVLANTLLSVLKREEETIRNLQTSILNCEQLHAENELLRQKNEKYLKEYTKMFDKAAQLNDVLSQYEMIFAKDIYTKIDLYSHSERPAIIYLKEFETLTGFDKLIETLYNAIRIQNKQSVKVLRLYDSSASRKVMTLPAYYTVIKNKYKMSDIDSNDFVCKTGDYTRILETLLLNRMHLDVLIIVDCKDHNDTVLSGSHIIFNVCGRQSSLEPLRLSSKNTITNDDTDLHWEDFNTSGMDRNQSFVYLSSRPVISTILQSVRQFEGI